VGVLRRRWLTVLAVIVIVASATGLVTSFQTPLYQASAGVLLSRSDLGASLPGVTASQAAPDSDRFGETQALLARTAEIAQRALAAAGVRDRDRTPAELLARSEVTPVQNTDLLLFRVSDRSPELAVRLATAYARSYKAYRLQLELVALRRALAEVRRKLAGQQPGSRLYSALKQKELDLATSAALPTAASVLLVRPAEGAAHVRPRWKRNVVFAAIFGIFLGVALAFILEALDRRVRRVDEIGDRLKVPLLGRVPPPPRSVRGLGGLLATRDAFGPHSEVFRTLALNLEMVNRNGATRERRSSTSPSPTSRRWRAPTPSSASTPPRIIMATSAVENEGKTTTLANLAVAFAEAGRKVVLVDLDLRHPSLDRLLSISALPGLTEVVDGHARLDEALKRIPLASGAGDNPSTRDRHPKGSLRVLPRGSAVLNPTEFLGSTELGAVFSQLAADADYVLVDTPPLLRFGDGVALFANVEATFVVARLGVVKQAMLNEIDRVLERSPVICLGYVVTGIRISDLFGYYEYDRPR
jgi:succinoglycan biosynthesis transport protein ExoP